MMLLPIALALPLFTQAPSSGAQNSTTAAVRIAEEDVAWDEVATWFLRTFGDSDMRGFIRRIAVHGEAAHRGLLPDPSAVQEEVGRTIAERVQGAFNGNHEAWLEELRELGDTEEARRASMQDNAAHELGLSPLVRGARTSEEATLRAAFEEQFGPGGITLDLERIVAAVAYPPRGPRQSRQEYRQARAVAEESAKSRLLALRLQITSGEAEFGDLARRVSDEDPAEAKREFDPRVLPEAAMRALYAQAPGQISEPVLYAGRWYLFRVNGKTRADFEEERAALEEKLANGFVSAPEASDWIGSLLARSAVRVFPQTEDWSLQSPVLQVQGATFTGRDLGAFMLLHEGGSLVRNFVAARLVEQEALAAGIEIDPAAVKARVAEDIRLQAEAEAKGDLAIWEAMLERRTGMTRASYEAQAAGGALNDLRAEALMASTRVVTEDELREAWELKYGPNGRSQEIRLLSVAIDLAGLNNDQDEEERQSIFEKNRSEALARATELRERASAGEDFGALCRAHSADAESAQNGGRLEGLFHEQGWPDNILKVVEPLPAGGFSQVIEYNNLGYLIIEVLRAEEHPYEEIEAALRKELLTARPSAVRTAGWINQRLEAVEWNRLPGFWRESARHLSEVLERAAAAGRAFNAPAESAR